MIVRKYGGSSLRSIEQINKISEGIRQPQVLVLSAQQGHTDLLFKQASVFKHATQADKNKYIAQGENNACLLMQLALQHKGLKAIIVDFQNLGLKADCIFEGQIISACSRYIRQKVEEGFVVIVPGFQAEYQGQLAILKRGASDDTAIALAIALNYPCEINSDVAFIHDQNANNLHAIGYDDLLKLITPDNAPMSYSGILMAKAAKLNISFKHWGKADSGTKITEYS